MARTPPRVSTSETTPLLGSPEPASKQITVDSTVRETSPHQRAPSKWSPTALLALTMLLVAIVTVGDGLSMTPLTRLFESVVCYQYWETHDPSKIALPRDRVGPGAVGGVPESWCKIQPVQAEVAALKGWQVFFDGIPSLIMALPIGAAADKYGRKPVIFLGCLSILLKQLWIMLVCWFWQSLPIRLVWVSALHGVISGSVTVLSAMVLVLVADVTDSSTRTIALLRIASSNMIMNSLAPVAGAALMAKFDLWIPLFASSLILGIGVVISFVLPETLNYYHASLEHQPLHPRFEQDPSDLLGGLSGPIPKSPPQNLKQQVLHMASSVRENTAFLFSDCRIILLFLPFVGLMAAEAARDLLVQYASVRYAVTMARATYFVSLGSLVKTATLLVFVPGATSLIARFTSLSAVRSDLRLARASAVLLAIGWILTAIAPSLPLFVAAIIVAPLGCGINSLCRSLVTGLVEKHRVGKLYTALSVIETLALMAGGPIAAALWDAGLRLGGPAIGFPFFFLGVVFVIVAIAMCFVGLKKGEEPSDLNEDEEEEIEHEGRTM